MELEEVLKTLKPIGYIPAEDTVKGKKLYVFQFPKSVPIESVKPMAEAVQQYIKDVLFIPDQLSFLSIEKLKEFIRLDENK